MEHHIVSSLTWILPATLFGIWLINRYLSRSKRASLPVLRQDMEIRLRSNDPPPSGNNTQEADLVFSGEVVFEIEEAWNDDKSRGTPLDGEVFDRIALYRVANNKSYLGISKADTYVAEMSRYNPRVIINPRALSGNPIPFFSFAKGFTNVEEASRWLFEGELASNDGMSDRLRSSFENHSG